MRTEFDHEWFWKTKLPERKGHRCRVLVRGRKNSVLVEFEDGFKVVTSRHAVRRRPQVKTLLECFGFSDDDQSDPDFSRFDI